MGHIKYVKNPLAQKGTYKLIIGHLWRMVGNQVIIPKMGNIKEESKYLFGNFHINYTSEQLKS